MSFTAGVLTVSDSTARGERVDTAGPAVAAVVENHGGKVVSTAVVADEREEIAARLREWSDERRVDVVVTTGGTGLSRRDITPEATLDVIERQVPGIAEVMREVGRRSTPLAALSRGVVGVRSRTLIINLPGSLRGARESLEAIVELLPHAVDLLHGDTEHPAG